MGINIKCDKCRFEINDNEEIYCEKCHQVLVDEVAELEKKIEGLEDKIIELEVLIEEEGE